MSTCILLSFRKILMCDQNSWEYIQSQNKCALFSSCMEQKSHKTVGAILHLNKYLLFGTMRIKYLYWKFLNFTSFVHRNTIKYAESQSICWSRNSFVHFISDFLAHLSRRLQGELLVYQWLRRPSSVRPSTFSNIFFSETTGPIELKFHMETP